MTLREFLKAEGLTQKAFGERVGIDRFRVSHILAGDTVPGLDLAARIERATRGQVPMESWVRRSSRR